MKIFRLVLGKLCLIWFPTLFMIVLGPAIASARVFQINSESFATYLRGTYGMAFTNTIVSESNSTGAVPVTMEDEYKYNFSGEFGFTYASPYVSLRIGGELIRPPEMSGVEGLNAGSSSLYTMKSQTTVFIPKAGLEFHLKRWPTSRFFFYGGVGSASLKSANTYALTTTGGTTYSPLTDFTEELKATALMYEGSFGYEGLLADSTTYVFEAGYRALDFKEIKHTKAVTNFQGTVTEGTVATNADGTNRRFNLSNYFFGLTLRWWLR
ncbi:MAG: hypothetical protein LW875_09560 [Proteobacteria bacterium]|jgi:hypothetical protein|nr:hypothetical protein [Pseudomonadota bacterium]